ncbi:MAG TPA: PHB depolymerase family esterase [Vicinamibacteria bacterium]|nr:PHB depolymerase family esterase [Vicinamibacteria bacterium]
MRRAAALAALLTLSAPAFVTARPPETGFLERSVRVGAASHAYKVYVPPGFDGGRSWPVILFLHGAGEAGTDGVQHTEVGLGRVLRSDPRRFPALVVFPQAPPGQVWLGDLARVATSALERTVAEFHGDPDRIYLAGLSMGAYGAWVLAFEDPQRYAAIVSVAGGIVPPAHRRARLAQLPPTLQADDPYAATAARVKGIPAWLFHGADDATVPVAESRRIVAALEKAGASPRYTEYAGVPHNAWDRAFAEPELAKWLLAQRRHPAPGPARR